MLLLNFFTAIACKIVRMKMCIVEIIKKFDNFTSDNLAMLLKYYVLCSLYKKVFSSNKRQILVEFSIHVCRKFQ